MKYIPVSSVFAMVDDDDYEKVIKYKWYLVEGYAYAKGGILLHNIIIQSAPMVDHKDRNRLNCQKENLRSCTPSLNQFNKAKQINNKSGYKGVSYHKKNNKWVAHIRVNKKLKYLGSFSLIEDAAIAYDEAALITAGTFAYLNFPKS